MNDKHIFPVGPYNLLTVHKSQGYTLENVIVCIDNMFEVSMMYTAATRASNSLMFYSKTGNNIQLLLEAFNKNDLDDLMKLRRECFKIC